MSPWGHILVWIRSGGAHLQLIKDIWGFLKTRKKWWLLPIVFVLILMAGLLILTESAVIAPFIYALF
jgi:hypothetical protein